VNSTSARRRKRKRDFAVQFAGKEGQEGDDVELRRLENCFLDVVRFLRPTRGVRPPPPPPLLSSSSEA